jgi:hydrogenase maturation protease
MAAHAPRVLLLGVGNLLWADEGFGPRCVEAFVARHGLPEGVSAMDGGTQGLSLVDPIRRCERLILFDAVDFGLEPGELRVLRDDQIHRALAARKTSLHQTTMNEVLACVELLGGGPSEITLIGVQPVVLEDYGGSLSAPVRARIRPAIEAAVGELMRWGIALDARSGTSPSDTELMAPVLALGAYETGRPEADAACRVGDDRFLALRARAVSAD